MHLKPPFRNNQSNVIRIIRTYPDNTLSNSFDSNYFIRFLAIRIRRRIQLGWIAEHAKMDLRQNETGQDH